MGSLCSTGAVDGGTAIEKGDPPQSGHQSPQVKDSQSPTQALVESSVEPVAAQSPEGSHTPTAAPVEGSVAPPEPPSGAVDHKNGDACPSPQAAGSHTPTPVPAEDSVALATEQQSPQQSPGEWDDWDDDAEGEDGLRTMAAVQDTVTGSELVEAALRVALPCVPRDVVVQVCTGATLAIGPAIFKDGAALRCRHCGFAVTRFAGCVLLVLS